MPNIQIINIQVGGGSQQLHCPQAESLQPQSPQQHQLKSAMQGFPILFQQREGIYCTQIVLFLFVTGLQVPDNCFQSVSGLLGGENPACGGSVSALISLGSRFQEFYLLPFEGKAVILMQLFRGEIKLFHVSSAGSP